MQVSLEASRLEGCAGMSETGQTTNGTRELFGNKDESEQSSSECTACMFVAVLHLKASPRLGCSRLWFHAAHLSDKRPTNNTTNNSWDETSLCSPPMLIVMEQLVKNGTRGKTWSGSAGMALTRTIKEWSNYLESSIREENNITCICLHGQSNSTKICYYI